MMQKLKKALEQSTKKGFQPRVRSATSESYSPETTRFRELSGVPSGEDEIHPHIASPAALLATIISRGHDYEKDGASPELLKSISDAKDLRHGSLATFLEKVPGLWDHIQYLVQKDAVRHLGNPSNVIVPGMGVPDQGGGGGGHPDTHDASSNAVIKPTMGVNLHALDATEVNNRLTDTPTPIGVSTPHGGKHSFNAINTGLHHYADDAAQFILQSLHNKFRLHEEPLPSALEMIRDHALDTDGQGGHRTPGLMSLYRQTRPWGIHSVQQVDSNNAPRIYKHPQMTTFFGDHNAENAFLGHTRDALLDAQIHVQASHAHLMNGVLGFHASQTAGGRHYLPSQQAFDEMNGAHMRHLNSLAGNLVAMGLTGNQLKNAIRLGSHAWAHEWHKEKGVDYTLGKNSAPSSPIIWRPEHATWQGAHVAWGKSAGLTSRTLNSQPEPWRKGNIS